MLISIGQSPTTERLSVTMALEVMMNAAIPTKGVSSSLRKKKRSAAHHLDPSSSNEVSLNEAEDDSKRECNEIKVSRDGDNSSLGNGGLPMTFCILDPSVVEEWRLVKYSFGPAAHPFACKDVLKRRVIMSQRPCAVPSDTMGFRAAGILRVTSPTELSPEEEHLK
ncbi:hypothetical protein Nepgr_015813 [Nepenthes gracilis]|uniref:Uncharacterized protein n=1 Tax=Nepenthes gracilis TaxID=150966 RepID=A0AAD3SMP9_NEPGR|nr:hypothetical protein Nepgr_015813 [Nepenthes gracilis]